VWLLVFCTSAVRIDAGSDVEPIAGTKVPALQNALQSVRPGQELYKAACAACHGVDGRGTSQELLGFDTPLPDFTDCSFATREPDADWFAIAHDGGPVRAFERRMPAFGDALASAEIERVISHLRTFCRNEAWPRGELNLPRALVTEKAYPEDEAVLTTVVDARALQAVSSQFLYERRFGARNQLEVMVPLSMQQSSAGSWRHGIGDVAAAVKRVLFHSLDRGAILSVTGELAFPTGNETDGLGKGVTIFEPFLSYGQLLPRNAFMQVQAGAELSADRLEAEHEVFWRAAVGRTFEQARFGRAWAPMIEVLGRRETNGREPALWDVVPEVHVTLTKRQHIMLNGGVRIPLNDRVGRSVQVITYFLWDWFDGSLVDGWR
jgi:mono/diheme cytochrome c family protein